MNKRLLRVRAPGQSIPLIALLIVVLFAMVGLSVDVGNTYAQQRATVRASDAAAMAGMTVMLQNADDSGVAQAIVSSLKSNKVVIADFQNGIGQTADNRTLTAQYLKADGNPLCYVGACSAGKPPAEAAYIQVRIEGFVDTYFARVVGRPTLPIKALSFVGKCAPTTGVYPIMIQSSYLDDTRFKPPTDPDEANHYALYSDETYKKVYQRRIYEKTAVSTSGGFGYARWLGATSQGSNNDTRDMFTTDGNLDTGFEEAPWPTGTALGAMPTGYPFRPGQLGPNDGDWIYGNSGVSNGVDPQLQELITNRTRLILPIINGESGSGNNAIFHVQRLGGFILRGYGNEPSMGKYFDLIYVGDVGAVACGVTNVVTTTNLGITGTVYVRPQHKLPPTAHQPVQYTVVLDTSGSMNWNFLGEAKKSNGTVLQCGASNDAARTAQRAQDLTACKAGGGAMWSPSSERRIAVAKKSLIKFIGLMDTYDAMKIVGFSSATVKATTTQWEYGTPTGKAALETAVLEAGKTHGDPYEADGGTPSATGLNEARKQLQGAPKTSTDGREFRQVTLFLTDGVANYFVAKTGNPDGFDWYNDGHDNPSCAGRDIDEETACHIGNTSTNPSIERPISAMATEGAELKKTNTVYVIALAGVTATGLTEVAQQATFPFYSEAEQAGQVDQIFAAINANVENPTCLPAGGTGFEGKVDPANTVTDTATRNSFSLPADTSVYGYVYLKDAYGQTLKTAPIKADPNSNGQLSFAFDTLTPGTYQLEAYVVYKGNDDPTPIARKYASILFPNLSHDTARTFNLAPSQTLNSIVALDPLYLDLTGVVCP